MRDVLRIETKRLVLRPLVGGGRKCDGQRVAGFLADFDVARMTSSIPSPYPPVAAEGWLMLMRARARLNEDFVFAIDLPGEGLIGCIGAHVKAAQNSIGYWIGKPFWGSGFASEALLGFVAEAESLGDLHAGHFTDNPASGRVLEKAGFKPTGKIEKVFSIARGKASSCRELLRRVRAQPAEDELAEAVAC